MADTLVKGAFHFNIDPAKMNIGEFEIPEELTITVSVGKELCPLKVSSACLPGQVQEAMDSLVEMEILKANQKAEPVASATTRAAASAPSAGAKPKNKDAELSLF